MGKQTPKAAEGKRKRTKKTKPSKPQKDDATRQAAADKRRERRQSKSQGSKRNMRRGKRTEAGGMKQKHTHMAAQALSRANPNASWYHKNCIDFSRKSEAKQAAIVNAILGDFPPPMRAALNCIAPSSFFADTPLQGPKGLFINSALTLQLLSSNQARKNVKSPALTKGTGADAPSAEGVSRAKRIIEARKPTLPLFDHLRSRHAKERSDAAGELVGYLKKAIKNVDKEALAAAGDSEKGIDALIGEVYFFCEYFAFFFTFCCFQCTVLILDKKKLCTSVSGTAFTFSFSLIQHTTTGPILRSQAVGEGSVRRR